MADSISVAAEMLVAHARGSAAGAWRWRGGQRDAFAGGTLEVRTLNMHVAGATVANATPYGIRNTKYVW